MSKIIKNCLIHGLLTKKQVYIYINKKYPNRNFIFCRQCRIIYKRKWRKENPCKVEKEQKNQRKLERLRTKKLKTRYGLSLDDDEKMLIDQNGVCAICNEKETVIDFRYNKLRRLSIDHCHKTGKVRSLLCSRCNTVIGLIKESDFIINNIKNYLEKHR